MPTGNLPVNNYLGNGQRTTSEFQTGIDQLLAYANSLKAEVDALSAAVIKEAAVRGVGTGASDLVQTSQLDTRLGGAGNLSLDSGIRDGSFSPSAPTLVWSGSTSLAIDYSTLSETGTGLYLCVIEGLIGGSANYITVPIYVVESGVDIFGSQGPWYSDHTSNVNMFNYTVQFFRTGSSHFFQGRQYTITDNNVFEGTRTIYQIYKV
ncbi:hypothetical protein MYE70_10730 [Marinobacter alexandrii]|uniref:hypothetical protein n=1 Tax=Marinobacter alexandrii TaxID=2570351 RepID=UPI001FFE2E54|nr:hypothetical protein [Marinobacter alexandrii]MCK2149541.1 hypothetical protein [Marinobacter alexandrii]